MCLNLFFRHGFSYGTLFLLFFSVSLFLVPTPSAHAALTDGLVGYWTFDGRNINWSSSTAEVLDSSGSGMNGNAVNMGTSSATIGKIGQGLVFDGSDDRVSIGVSAYDTLTTSTGCAWVRPRTIATDDAIVSKYSPGANDGFLFMRDDVGSVSGRVDVFTIFLTDGGVGNRVESQSNASKLNAWSHVCYTYTLNTANGLRLYINGSEDPNSPASTVGIVSLSSAANFDIGSASSDAGLRESDMVNDDVRIYNRALTATEVRQLYNQGATKLGVTPTVASTTTGINYGLVGHWTFDGKNTNWSSSTAEVLDSSGNGVNGNATNMGTSSATIGRIGQGVDFMPNNVDADSYVTMGDPSSGVYDFDTNDFTYNLWVRSRGYVSQGSSFNAIISKKNNTGGNATAGFSIMTNGSFLSQIGNGSSGIQLSAGVSDASNTWRLLTVRRTGDTFDFLVDGVVRDTDTLSGSLSNSSHLIVGSDAVAARTFNGVLDDVRIYNRALSTSTIQQLYNLGATKLGVTPIVASTTRGISSGLVGHWTFDGKDTVWTSSTTATSTDKSGNGHHATLTNMNQSTSTAKGVLGQGFRFDGTDDRLVVADNSNLDGMANLTVSGWIYQVGNGGSGLGRLLEKSTDYGILYSGAGSNRWIGRINNNDALTGTISNLFNRWHNITMVYDGATTTMYVDGVVSGTPLAVTGNVGTNATALTIGNTTGSRTFDGVMDDVRLYNRALTASEVRQLYNFGRSTTR